MRKAEVFLGPVACLCSGVFDLRDQEKHSLAEMLIAALRERADQVELRVFNPSEDSAYAEYVRKLRGYLRQAGEDDLADRIAFSLEQITPAIAVDGRLDCFGTVPPVDEFLERVTEQANLSG
ncbi:MAG: hypothetical protein AB1384_06610 [Actinomycetota bacterium]